jgi:hypothetical protein
LAALALATTPAARAETVYAVDSRALLLSFDSQLPDFINSVRLIRGLQPGEGILAIDFRPANKRLYGLGSSSRVYVIDTSTGQATPVGSGPFSPALDGTDFGFDFNPTVDRIRVVSNTGQNLRLHPDTGQVAAVDMPLNYEDGTRPSVVASAYTNSVAGATSTVLYGIDSRRRVLVTQNPPNDGKLNAVGPLTNLDLSNIAGFDISPTTGAAYAIVRQSGGSQCMFYQIHLTTGDYYPIAWVNIFEQVSGLAVAPAN